MKSGFVGRRLSTALLVATVQEILEHTDRDSSDHFLCQPIPGTDNTLAEEC